MSDPASWLGWAETLGELAAPPRCLGCGGDRRGGSGPSWEAWLCPACRGRVERIEAACRGCGRGFGPHAAAAARCPACRHRVLGVRGTTALLRYRGPARAMLRRLKYGGADALAEPLGRALGERLRVLRPPPRDLFVLPLPLHPWRRWRRGFNQAEGIASGVAAALERPLVLDVLVRRRATRPLYGVPRERRDQVLEGAFALRRPARLRGRPVLLVDDIRTSGATLRAAGRVLRRAKVRWVEAAVVGR